MERVKSPLISCTVKDQRETLYTCPANCRTKVPLVYIVNANGNTDVLFEIYKAAEDTYYYIIAGKNFAEGEFLQLSDAYIVLEAGDKLEVTPSGNTSPLIDALCTVEETFYGNSPIG
jgi:hypothetical protein